MRTFIIEDEIHAGWMGKINSFDEAMPELKRLSIIPWNEAPNCCHCTSWKTCSRNYQIVEYNTSTDPWQEIKTTPIFDISSEGIAWKI